MPAPPPLPPLLQAELAGLRPVRLRRPGRQLAVTALASLMPAAAFCAFVVSGGLSPAQPRPVTHGPLGWTALMATVWAGCYLAALAAALLPGAGQVMPDPRRAGATALAVAGLLVGASLLSAWHGHGAPPPTVEQPTAVKCIAGAMICALTPLVAGLRALRGVRQRAPWATGLALGVAGAALGGLHLSLACPVPGGTGHHLVGHGGPLLIAGVLGAVASTWLAHRER